MWQAPTAPVRTRFCSGMFCIARAEALVVDAPPDAHAPFLNLGDELSTAARLWTRGYQASSPVSLPQCPPPPSAHVEAQGPNERTLAPAARSRRS